MAKRKKKKHVPLPSSLRSLTSSLGKSNAIRARGVNRNASKGVSDRADKRQK